MTRALVAPCAFKGTLPASRAAQLIGAALRDRGFVVDECPLPDGGEGTVDALTRASRSRVPPRFIGQSTDANSFFFDVAAGVFRGESAWFVESAAFVGLATIPREQRDGTASSLPLGRAVASLLRRHRRRRVVIALGGTGIVDGGRGFADAVGDLAAGVAFTGLVDVNAPLCGPSGARLYFAQKGVPPHRFDDVERALCALHPRFVDVPGAGAAGGLGAAVLARGGDLISGAAFVADAVDLEARVAASDVVIAGEGRVDAQTLQGKSLAHVRALARKHGKRFVVICGSCVVDDVGADLADGVIELGAAGLVDARNALRAAAAFV